MCYWWDACLTATFLINRLPTKVLDNKSPMQKLFQKYFDFSKLKVLECECFPFICPYKSRKLSYHFQSYVYLGYSPIHKGYKCKSLKTGKICISPNIIFDENHFPYHSVSTNNMTF